MRQGDRDFAPAGGFSARHAVTTINRFACLSNPVQNMARIARVVPYCPHHKRLCVPCSAATVKLSIVFNASHRNMSGFREKPSGPSLATMQNQLTHLQHPLSREKRRVRESSAWIAERSWWKKKMEQAALILEPLMSKLLQGKNS